MSRAYFPNAVQEMHILSYFYKWDRNTVWNLNTKERKMWVDCVKDQIDAENKANSNEPEFDPDFLRKND